MVKNPHFHCVGACVWSLVRELRSRIPWNVAKNRVLHKYVSLVAQLVKNPPDLIPGSGRSPGEGMGYLLEYSCAFLVAQMVKSLPAIQETWIRFLGWENPLEKGTATHSSFLAWRIPQTKEPGRLQSMESQRIGHDWATLAFKKEFSLFISDNKVSFRTQHSN